MRVITGHDLDGGKGVRAAAATLGFFDGVHRGHRKVILETLDAAAETGGEAVVVTFANHPDALLRGAAPPLLTSLPHRLRLLEREGVDAVVLLDFDEKLRDQEAATFARELFLDRLGLGTVVLGHGCRFGKGGRGSIETFRELARSTSLSVREVGPALHDGSPVSSTRIRRAVEAGDLETAAFMLGRPVSIFGTVVRGDGRGRLLGFPTANLDTGQEVHPPGGVYGARVTLDGKTVLGLLNIGSRPTFEEASGRRQVLEIHLLSFEGDLYGRTLEVQILERLRSERKFPDIDALRAQIEQDRETFLRLREQAAVADEGFDSVVPRSILPRSIRAAGRPGTLTDATWAGSSVGRAQD